MVGSALVLAAHLWHWPILIIAAERVGQTSLPVGENLLLLVLAMAITMATFRFVENPIRHIKVGPRNQRASVVLGVCLSALTIGVMTVLIGTHSAASDAGRAVAMARPRHRWRRSVAW